MNRPSEWMKFYDARTGRYGFRHKWSGVIRDTLMAIDKHLFHTFALDGWAKLATCSLPYGSTFYPELEYDGEDQIRIRSELIDFSYRRNDVNTGTQLNVANYSTTYSVVYLDLRPTKESMTGDERKLVLYYRLNQAATADYRLFAAVLNEEEVVVQQIGNELVAV